MTNISEIEVFKEVLVAAARGPFFPDWEFHTIFGLDRAKVEAIAEEFSQATPLTGDVALALHNSMNNLLGYPHDQEAVWARWLSVTPDELEAIFVQWQASFNEA